MKLNRYNHYRSKPVNYGIINGFLISLSIHAILFFVGGRLFVSHVQYGIQLVNEGIEVELIVDSPQSETHGSLISATMPPRLEMVKAASQEALATPPQPEAETFKLRQPEAINSIESVREQPLEKANISSPLEETRPLLQSTTDTAKPLTTEQHEEAAKTIPGALRGGARTKSRPGYLQNRPPIYPPLARKMRQEGLVILRVKVDRKGMPAKVEVEQSSGFQLLDQAALEAVRHWRFEPERIGGMPVESNVAIPIRFRLEE
jgi:protein TonB